MCLMFCICVCVCGRGGGRWGCGVFLRMSDMYTYGSVYEDERIADGSRLRFGLGCKGRVIICFI